MKVWINWWCVLESTLEISLPCFKRNWTASSMTIGFKSLTYRSQIFLYYLIFCLTIYFMASSNPWPSKLIPERAEDIELILLTYFLIMFCIIWLPLKPIFPPMTVPWPRFFIMPKLLGPPKREAPDIYLTILLIEVVSPLESVFFDGLLLASELKLFWCLRFVTLSC